MSRSIKLRKGFHIRLRGKAEKVAVRLPVAATYGVKPVDFHGITPKLLVRAGDKVEAGSSLFFSKEMPDIQFTAPVSGTIKEIVRGEKRKILEVVIEADKEIVYKQFAQANPNTLSRDEIIQNLLDSGLWVALQQRPYNVVANPQHSPKSIFISGFDTSPLAPDIDFIVRGNEAEFQTGIDALQKLTTGKIHLSLDANYPPSKVFTQAQKVERHYFSGPHPAGNVGIQIHHIDPINKGDVVWTIKPQHLIAIGRFFQKGILDLSRVIALNGSEVLKPKYYKIVSGCSIAGMIQDNVSSGKTLRYISGNVLTGSQISANGHLGFFDTQVNVIPEGNYHEMFGWATPGFKKFSFSRTFLSSLFPSKTYVLDTNYHGGERAFVMTGQYEKVLPMDILPQQLLKAILANDIDMMENLGIYEVVEEDLALCEYVCTSKIEVQAILREGINQMIKELS